MGALNDGASADDPDALIEIWTEADLMAEVTAGLKSIQIKGIMAPLVPDTDEQTRRSKMLS